MDTSPKRQVNRTDRDKKVRVIGHLTYEAN